ncbi:MAG: GatB/YqeY domain-containing protein [Anaerolineae bacterium]|nr:GatB/YqeY domain-containing protein [Anaerolineae bacterium]
MNLRDELTNALKESMKSGNTVRKQTVRMILSNIKNAEIDSGKILDDGEIINILFKEVKIRQDAIDEAHKGNRFDIVASNQAELSVVESFLPKPFSEEELRQLVQTVIDNVGAESKRQMGIVMKELIPRLQGRASSAEASKIVQDLLP